VADGEGNAETLTIKRRVWKVSETLRLREYRSLTNHSEAVRSVFRRSIIRLRVLIARVGLAKHDTPQRRGESSNIRLQQENTVSDAFPARGKRYRELV